MFSRKNFTTTGAETSTVKFYYMHLHSHWVGIHVMAKNLIYRRYQNPLMSTGKQKKHFIGSRQSNTSETHTVSCNPWALYKTIVCQSLTYIKLSLLSVPTECLIHFDGAFQLQTLDTSLKTFGSEILFPVMLSTNTTLCNIWMISTASKWLTFKTDLFLLWPKRFKKNQSK